MTPPAAITPYADRDGRELAWQPSRAPRPGEAEPARALVAYALPRAGG